LTAPATSPIARPLKCAPNLCVQTLYTREKSALPYSLQISNIRKGLVCHSLSPRGGPNDKPA